MVSFSRNLEVHFPHKTEMNGKYTDLVELLYGHFAHFFTATKGLNLAFLFNVSGNVGKDTLAYLFGDPYNPEDGPQSAFDGNTSTCARSNLTIFWAHQRIKIRFPKHYRLRDFILKSSLSATSKLFYVCNVF